MMNQGRPTHHILISFCFAPLILASLIPAQQSGEKSALLDFLDCFPATCGVRMRLALTWKPHDDHPCTWDGVTCDPATRHVTTLAVSNGDGGADANSALSALGRLPYLTSLTLQSLNMTGPLTSSALANCSLLESLDLTGNNLSGRLPPEFFRSLPSLKSLYLGFNRFSGSVPKEIALCRKLEVVIIPDNKFTGKLPDELGELQNLQVFRAGGNPLTGPIPASLGNCTNLVHLGIAVSNISGSIPASLGRLPQLSTLLLFHTNLSGEIPASLANLSMLTELHLFQNRLTGPLPPNFGANMPLLERLYLWGNLLSGSIPASLSFLSSLQVIDLSQNQFTGHIPLSLGNLTSVSKLYLSVNNLTGTVPPSLGRCGNLTDLQLDRNKLTGSIPAELGNLTHLAQLFLWNNSLTGSIPSSLSNCPDLEFLDLSWNHLEGPLPPELFLLPGLHKFLLMANNLSGSIPASISSCKCLYRLRLGRNQFSGQIPPRLADLQNLTFFDISDNFITGVLPPELGSCRSLQLLDAHGNRLTGSIPSELGQLEYLQVLDLSWNQLTGYVPPELGVLGELVKLSLRENRLTGSIPGELGRCRKLAVLEMGGNRLTGSVPAELGQISTLSVSLNICCNSLTGTIPDEFAALFALTDLDVSHNNLTGNLDVLARMGSLATLNISDNQFYGRLPDTYLFKSMPKSNYEGNPDLCIHPDATCSESGYGETEQEQRKRRTIIALLFGTVGVMFAIGAVLLCAMVKTSLFGGSLLQDEAALLQEYAWELTPFQKLSFTLDDVLDCIVETNVIGKGCSGVVYRAAMPGGETIAVKKIIFPAQNATNVPRGGRSPRDFFSAEVSTLRLIRHNSIIRLLGYATNNRTSLLLYDYMPNGSLGEFIHEKRKMLDWEARYKIALGAAQALAYLHHDCVPPIIHRDIKANNILLGARLEPYLADFGLAKIVASSQSTTQTLLAGSYGYIAPEYAYTFTITDKSDVFSYGVVLLEILTGKRPVDPSLGEGRHLTQWVHEMQHCHHDVTEILDPRLRGMPDPFIQEMLYTLGIAMDCVHPHPGERPTMRHVVSLLVSIRHDIEEYTKVDVLGTTCKPSKDTPTINNSTNTPPPSHHIKHINGHMHTLPSLTSFTHSSSVCYSHSPPHRSL